MKLKIREEKDSAILYRKEVVADVDFDDKTPSREKLRDKLSSLMKVPVETVIVKKVDSVFGEKKAVVFANVYKNAEDIPKIESKSKRLESQIKKEEPKDKEQPAEQSKDSDKQDGKEAAQDKEPEKENKADADKSENSDDKTAE